jgi:hypothetical protein
MDDLKQAFHSDDPNDDDVKNGRGQPLRLIDNVDKVEFPLGLASVSDDAFAAAMNQELDTYIPSAVKRGLLLPT